MWNEKKHRSSYWGYTIIICIFLLSCIMIHNKISWQSSAAVEELVDDFTYMYWLSLNLSLPSYDSKITSKSSLSQSWYISFPFMCLTQGGCSLMNMFFCSPAHSIVQISFFLLWFYFIFLALYWNIEYSDFPYITCDLPINIVHRLHIDIWRNTLHPRTTKIVFSLSSLSMTASEKVIYI